MILLDDFPFVKQDLAGSVVNAEYLVEIQAPGKTIYLATRKQMFTNVDGNRAYYDDLNLKISNIKEKIDLKTKKIQLSNMNFTISNYALYGDVLSDKLVAAIGAEIIVHIKTQSCETVDDCLPIAHLKITRVEHDEKSVRINADDVSLEHFYLDLPSDEYVLDSEVNTFKAYHNKPIPILYGQLDSAPAVLYNPMSSSEGIRLYCDVSGHDDSNSSEIDGIKTYKRMPSPFDTLGTNLVNNDSVQIKIGESLCSVNCVPYINSRDAVRELHTYEQYEVNHNYVSLHYYDDVHLSTTLLENKALWVHTIDEPVDQDSITVVAYCWNSTDAYPYYQWDYGNHPTVGEWNEMYGLATGYEVSTVQGVPNTVNSMGAEKYTFPVLSGINIYETGKEYEDPVPMPTDINFTGNLELWMTAGENAGAIDAYNVFGYTTPYNKNAECWDSSFTSPSGGVNFDVSAGMLSAEESGLFPSLIVHDFDSNGREVSGGGVGNSPFFSHEMLRYFNKTDVFEFKFKGIANDASVGDVRKFQRTYFLSEKYSIQTYPFTHGSAGEQSPFKAYLGSDHGNLQHVVDGTWTNDEPVPHPITSSNELTFYHYINELDSPNIPLGQDGTPNVIDKVQTLWQNLKLRRFWAQADIFDNDFYVSARGRVGSSNLTYKSEITSETSEIQKFNGNQEIKVWYDHVGGTPTQDNYDYYNAKHLYSLYEALTDKEYRYIYHDNKKYELMIYIPGTSNGKEHYMYEIDVNNIGFHTNADTYISHSPYDPSIEGVSITHNAAWIIKFTAKTTTALGQFQSSSQPPDSAPNLRSHAGNLTLVYARRYFGAEGYVKIEKAPGSATVGEMVTIFNEENKGGVSDSSPSTFYKHGYTHISWHNTGDIEPAKELIQNPAAVIEDVLQAEMGVGAINAEKYKNSYDHSTRINLSFSINEQKNSKDLIEDICRQSNIMFRYRPRDKMAILDVMQPEYSSGSVDKLINTKRILSYKYTKSKIEDLCIGGCIVKWGYDYSKEELMNTTAPATLDPVTLLYYKTTYGIQDEANYQLEAEAPYINDELSALALRDFLFAFYKHQHLIVKFALPIQDGIELEVGDIVRFDDNINGLKPYGVDITSANTKIDQIVYPYFMVTSVSKNINKVDLEVFQLHFIRESDVELPSSNAPIVNAGADQIVQSGDTVTLYGTAEDPDGGAIATFAWYNQSDVSNDQYMSWDMENWSSYPSGDGWGASFTVPYINTSDNMNGMLYMKLHAWDEDGDWGVDYVTVQIGTGDMSDNIVEDDDPYEPAAGFYLESWHPNPSSFGEKGDQLDIWVSEGLDGISDKVEYRVNEPFFDGTDNLNSLITQYNDVTSDFGDFTHFILEQEYFQEVFYDYAGYGHGWIRIHLPYISPQGDSVLSISARIYRAVGNQLVWSEWSDPIEVQLLDPFPGGGDGEPRPSRVALIPNGTPPDDVNGGTPH